MKITKQRKFNLLSFIIVFVFGIISFSNLLFTFVSGEPVSYTLQDYDNVSNRLFKDTSFLNTGNSSVTKGEDRYGFYWDITMAPTIQWGMPIVQFPLPIDITNSSFSYEILSPQTTYWLIVGIASKQIDPSVQTSGGIWSMSQADDGSGNLSNRGTLGMYMYEQGITPFLKWQKSTYYNDGSNQHLLTDCLWENGNEETISLSAEADTLKVNVSGTDVNVDAKVSDYTNNQGYVQFQTCSSATGQASKVRLRMNKQADRGEDFVVKDLTEYDSSDVTAESFAASKDTWGHSSYTAFNGTDAIGDYYDISLKINSAWSVSMIQFPIPLDILSSEGNLSFSYEFLTDIHPFWVAVGVSSEPTLTFKNFTDDDGSESAYGVYFYNQSNEFKYIWNKNSTDFDANDLTNHQIDTNITYAKKEYVHYKMEKVDNKLGVYINGTLMSDSEYTDVFANNKGYITFMACSELANESTYFRLRLGTNGNEDYTNEAEPLDINPPQSEPESITIKEGNKIIQADSTFAMNAGEYAKLTHLIMPVNAAYESVVWKSSDTSVAEVLSTGKITAKKAGIAKITVTVDGTLSTSFNVTVSGEVEEDVKPVEKDNNLVTVIIIAVIAVVVLAGGSIIFLIVKGKKKQ